MTVQVLLEDGRVAQGIAVVNQAGGIVDSLNATLDALPPYQIAYNADGTINYWCVSYGGNNYKQTLSYTTGLLTSVGEWVKL